MNTTQLTPNWPSSVVLSSEVNNVLGNLAQQDIEDLFTKKTEIERRDLLEKCLKHEQTNYGRCVYKMDNDVCDNQVLNLQFADRSTATMTMIATTKDICARKTKVYGTKGQLDWDDARNDNTIEHYDFLTGKTNVIDCKDAVPDIKKEIPQKTASGIKNDKIKLSGHGGSDFFLMDSFVEAILRNDKSYVLTDVEDSFRSHLIVFAAEYSRRNNVIVDIKDFCQLHAIPLF